MDLSIPIYRKRRYASGQKMKHIIVEIDRHYSFIVICLFCTVELSVSISFVFAFNFCLPYSFYKMPYCVFKMAWPA